MSTRKKQLPKQGCPVVKRSRSSLMAAATTKCGRATPAQAGIERAVAALETEAVRRALAGVAVPVFHQGRECGSTVKHSDQLLMFLLKTLKPERYAGTKEPAPAAPAKIFALDIDLPGQGEEDTEADGGAAGEGAEDEAEEEAGLEPA